MKKILISLICSILFISMVKAKTSAPIDIRYASVLDLIEAMDTKIITSEQLINLYLERIQAYNETYNAVLFINENAISEAKKIDEARARNEELGRLAGIPIIIKTNIDATEFATTGGSKALIDNLPNEDAVVIQKLKEEGAIILASANMSEFAFSAYNSNSSYGNVHNAFNQKYTSYGSSGGSAVSVALSFAPIALGTDTNSSVRIPASAANLVGIRPSINQISTDGVIPYDTTRDVVGILTKTVADNNYVYQILTESSVTNERIDLNGVVIGIPLEFYEGSKSASLAVNQKTFLPIKEMMEGKIAYLESQGATIVHLDKFYTSTNYNTAQTTMAGFTFCKGFNDYISDHDSKITSFNALTNSKGKIYSLSGYNSMCNYKLTNAQLNAKQTFQNYIASIYETQKIDLIIYPTIKNELALQGENKLVAPGSNLGSVINYPSITVPLGFYQDLPYGLEFMAPTNQEALLYEVAAIYEQSNTFTVTNTAPSLYEIPDSVNELVITYQEIIENHSNLSLIKEIQTFFSSYNEIENKEQLATAILEIKQTPRENAVISNAREGTIYVLYFFSGLLIMLLCLKQKKTPKP